MGRIGKKEKYETVAPRGRMFFTTYLSDRGGVGYIRSIVPMFILGSWRYKTLLFEPNFFTQYITDVSYYKNQAFVKFQRSATDDQLRMFEHFTNLVRKQTGTPCIYEIDDILFDVPRTNHAAPFYRMYEDNIKKMLSMVDGITVSTPYLKKCYEQYNDNISVVKNRLGKCLWGDIKQCKPKKRKKPKILYPGSDNHFYVPGRSEEEGGDFGRKLIEFIKETKKDKYEWVFVGGMPNELRGDEDITHHEWLNYTSYPTFMKNIDVDLGIAPLDINDFNRGKSNLKMLEYCASGIPAIYTHIEPYFNATLTTKTEEDMISKIEELASNEQKRYNTWKKDTDRLKSNLFLEDNLLKWLNEHMKLFKRILE